MGEILWKECLSLLLCVFKSWRDVVSPELSKYIFYFNEKKIINYIIYNEWYKIEVKTEQISYNQILFQFLLSSEKEISKTFP